MEKARQGGGLAEIFRVDEMSLTNTDSRKKSVSEALVNSFGSYPIGYAVGIVILPISIGWLQEDLLVANLAVTLIYATVSFARTYLFRRVFERLGFDDNFIKLGKRLYQKIRARRHKVII